MAWPKLSETLPRTEPGACQQCGAAERLTYWRECDDRDQKTGVFVVLCQPCADRVIEPHPRLYCETSDVTPMPGAMPICLDCGHRDGRVCLSPQARFNGGPGLQYQPEGQMVHLCRSPRRLSGWQYFASGPVEICSGKEIDGG
jgi:hypothetical protein